MTVTEIIDQIGQIESSQATFVNLKVNGHPIRIDFIDKKEFSIKSGAIGAIKYLNTHPLLLDYNEKMVTTYINSKAGNVDQLVNEISKTIDAVTLGFRKWTTYVTDDSINFTLDVFNDNLKEGRGKLMEAPVTITRAVVAVCDKHNIATKSFEPELQPAPNKLLAIGSCYIIAKEFKVRLQ